MKMPDKPLITAGRGAWAQKFQAEGEANTATSHPTLTFFLSSVIDDTLFSSYAGCWKVRALLRFP